jgi:hypothetical protein
VTDRIGIMALPGTARIEDLKRLGVTTIRMADRSLVADGRVNPNGIRSFREAWGPYVAAGFRLHAVTPFPLDLEVAGEQDGREARWRRVGCELGEALADLVESWQIGNELNIWQFRQPLVTLPESVRFVAALGNGLRETSPSCRLGINAFGVGEGTATLYRALYGPEAPIALDYAGVDAYPGSWEEGGPDEWRRIVDRVWELGRGQPISICEIGFPSRGDLQESGEFVAWLRALGYDGVEAVERDRDRLLAASPEPLAAAFELLPTESWGDDFEDSGSHLLRKWRRTWDGTAQTPEKQARYFEEALGILLRDGRVAEILLFLFRDLDRCWSCGQADCPLETAWGFVDREGRRKPVFDAVRRLIAPAPG